MIILLYTNIEFFKWLDCLCSLQQLFDSIVSRLKAKLWNQITKYIHTQIDLGRVVQSIISLTSLLVVKMLTVLVSIISNSQVFLLKNSCKLDILYKLLIIFQQKY